MGSITGTMIHRQYTPEELPLLSETKTIHNVSLLQIHSAAQEVLAEAELVKIREGRDKNQRSAHGYPISSAEPDVSLQARQLL